MNYEEKIGKILKKVQKPTSYTGGEYGQIIKERKEGDTYFAFCFPDTYEIGMSHLGMKILYGLTNEMENVHCERCFAPSADMEAELIKENIPLFSLETKKPLCEFDFVGFTLQYELCYTNVLNMLKLSGIPLLRSERTENDPIIVAGGPCAANPEPLSDFVDFFIIGEGEEVNPEFIKLYRECNSKEEYLTRVSEIEGIYVPSKYTVTYNEDNTIKEISPSKKVNKRIIEDLSSVYYPKNPVVPFGSIVFDRAMLEIFRGCIRGCRFCQAGFIYRPVREKSKEVLCGDAFALCENTGYDEISLSSLSSSDYTEIEPLLDELYDYCKERKINLALPSLRTDNFSKNLYDKIMSLRKSGLTFAPEAGSQRLRDAINKNVSEQDLMRTCAIAFDGGASAVKLYFMMGLPTETDEDIKAIPELCEKVIDLYYKRESRPKKPVSVSISVAVFVPKPFTPFQWEAQDSFEEIERKQALLLQSVKNRKIKVSYHDKKTSILEAVFARGDRRLGKVILNAFNKGCKFDSWDEYFDYDKWMQAFKEENIDPLFYTQRQRNYDEILPWDIIDIGVNKDFFINEMEKAIKALTTPHCREKCSGCGIKECKLWK